MGRFRRASVPRSCWCYVPAPPAARSRQSAALIRSACAVVRLPVTDGDIGAVVERVGDLAHQQPVLALSLEMPAAAPAGVSIAGTGSRSPRSHR